MLIKLQDSLIVTLFAMAIVFAVLVVLMFVIRSQTRIFARDKSKSTEKSLGSTAQDKIEEIQLEQSEAVADCDDEEVVAAIIAAICAHTGMTMEQFEIKSIKKVGNTSWRKQNLFS